jgi:light-regulated signal transduction histidine kinase (bacteriophytochrome)
MRFADRLFGAYQRLHSRDEFPGAGVGLAIVKRAMERHGGRAWAEAVPDRGARFYISLPVPTEAAP